MTHRMLSAARRPVPRSVLEERLECSTASVKRIIRELRDYLGAPVVYDRQHNGYRYALADGETYELPGLWFNAQELLALAALQALLAETGPGLLDDLLRPLRRRLDQLLGMQRLNLAELPARLRLLPMAVRRPNPSQFQTVAAATLRRRRLRLAYHARRGGLSRREVSPQRLVQYRHNWYLDAWCHAREGLRTFALERIQGPEMLPEPAHEVPPDRLDAHLAAGYGIFAGAAGALAVLRFEPEHVPWVAEEIWHPRQESEHLPDGRYELRIPYADPTELILDVLRYGPGVEVVAPAELRSAVAERLARAAARYRDVAVSGNEPVGVVKPSGESS